MNTETLTARMLTTEAPSSRTTLVRGAALGVGSAWILTTAVYLIGNIGVPIRVVTGWSPDGADLTYVEVVATVAISIALGGLLLWALERRTAKAFFAWTLVAAATTVVSAVPLWGLDVGTDSKVALTTMHLVTGLCAIAGQALARRDVRLPDASAAR